MPGSASATRSASPASAQAGLAISADRTGDDPDVDAAALIRQLAPLLGGGGGGSPEVAVAGGKDPTGIDAALDEARRILERD